MKSPHSPHGPETRDHVYLSFKKQLLMTSMAITCLFATMFAVLHDLGINTLTDFQARVDYIYAFFILILLIVAYYTPRRFSLILGLFLVASFLTFVAALVAVPEDKFRVIWFYMLIMVAFFLGGSATGVAAALLSLVAILGINSLVDLKLNAVTMNSILVGLVAMSSVVHIFAKRTREYSSLVDEKNNQLTLLATEDPLTGIKNARYFRENGARLIALSKRNGSPLALLYLDVDHFKLVNDRYGHHMGDEVLIALAQTVKSALRKTDVFARIGGEEFCVILPDTGAQGAQVMAEKLRSLIASQPISLDGETLAITVSIGVSELQGDDESMRPLQMRADTALYQAKNTGRNCVVLSEANNQCG